MSVAMSTKELNYAVKREKAVSCTSSRVSVPPSNGSSFSTGQSIDLKLPSGMARGSYIDFQNSYVKISITATRAADSANNDLKLPRNGIFNLFEKIELMSSSSTISTVDSYNKLLNVFLDSECSQDFKASVGEVGYGMTNESTYGAVLTPAAGTGTKTTTYCVPLLLLSLFSSTKYIPAFHNDNLSIRLTLASRVGGFISGTGVTDANAAITINPVSMIYNIVRLSEQAQMMIDQSCGGVYSLVLDDWQSTKYGTVQTGDRSVVANLGFSHQSISRIVFAFYLPEAAIADSNGTRVSRSVSEYCFQLNGQNHPAVKIKADFRTTSENHSEILAEIRASTRRSADFQSASTIDSSTMIDGAGGRSFFEIDLESLRSGDDGVYSGLYTVGANTSVSIDMNQDGATAAQLNIWGQFQGSLRLDTNTGNVFTYSV